jgi:hypothetical protein
MATVLMPTCRLARCQQRRGVSVDRSQRDAGGDAIAIGCQVKALSEGTNTTSDAKSMRRRIASALRSEDLW